ncbi:MAG TPA: SPW repeat protein [Pararhizobium sp.]|jgi:hypothetical protein|nr:SPW repeat protein [Pararhizobium sp.]
MSDPLETPPPERPERTDIPRSDPTAMPPPRRRFQPPKWQDWANLVLAIWLFFSPWILQFGANAPQVGSQASAAVPIVAAVSNAAWNAWVLGVIVFLVSASALGGRFARQQEWINLLLGIWIFIAPWVLGFGYGNFPLPAWDHWIVGALIFLISASKLSASRTMRPPGAAA